MTARGVHRSIAVFFALIVQLLQPPLTAADKYHPLIQKLHMIDRRGKPHVRQTRGLALHLTPPQLAASREPARHERLFLHEIDDDGGINSGQVCHPCRMYSR